MQNKRITKAETALPEGTMNYYRLKKGRKPFVMLHGRMENGLCWSRVAETIEGDFDVYMPDIRGHGATNLADREISITVLLDDIISFIESLNLSNPVLMGHSMGAGIAALYAAAHPGNVTALILSDPPWLLKKDYIDGDISLVKKMQNVIRTNKSLSLNTLSAYIHFSNQHWDTRDCRLLAQAWKEARELVAFSYNSPVPYAQWENNVKKINCPVLLLTSNPRKGGILTPRSVRHIKNLYPRIVHEHFPTAGHAIMRDTFVPYVQAINNFILQKLS
ncbi:MAG: alpha/beta fold hydrolase [Chitinivibrionales bacterium]|nr:alpha/beta fold hydrolase [Chitinivibrionales bacterium]